MFLYSKIPLKNLFFLPLFQNSDRWTIPKSVISKKNSETQTFFNVTKGLHFLVELSREDFLELKELLVKKESIF